MPWSAVRLLRVLRGGELPATGWDGWRVLDGGRLVTPAGVVFRASEFEWWALTCLQARSWQRAYDRETGRFCALQAQAQPVHALDPVEPVPAPGSVTPSDQAPPEVGEPPAKPALDLNRIASVPALRIAPASRTPAAAGLGDELAGCASDCTAAAAALSSGDLISRGAMPDSFADREVPSANRGLKNKSDASVASSPHHYRGDAHV